jgi:molybdopterin-guanine dinucleotide biosynthesis protein B
VLVESFRHAPFPKIELHRPALGKSLLYPRDASIVAIATDALLPLTPTVMPALRMILFKSVFYSSRSAGV